MGKIIDSSLSNVWRSHTEMKALEIHKIWHNVFSLLKFESILRLVGKKAKPKLLVSSPTFHKLKMMDWNIKRNIISINFLIVISTSGVVILQDNSHAMLLIEAKHEPISTLTLRQKYCFLNKIHIVFEVTKMFLK